MSENSLNLIKCNIYCCYGTGCISLDCKNVFDALNDAVKSKGLSNKVEIIPTGCMGLCSKGPLLRIETNFTEPVLYGEVKPILARLIIAEHISELIKTKGKDFKLPEFIKKHTIPLDIPFFEKQTRILLSDISRINPYSIESYIENGGYEQIKKVISTMPPDDVIQEIAKSELRGRGGGGYPTGKKLYEASKVQSDKKFVVCNGDEGDPGAFMDRSLLEGNPHSVIEGMLIAGYSVGSDSGWFHIRAEYPLAVKRIKEAIKQAEKQGFLGKNILGSNFSFSCNIRLGAGAFVCGEETALIASIEGKRGNPSPRPPFPFEKGLWEKPTCVNNVETLANLPLIIKNGGKWYSEITSSQTKGTKIFTLTGKIKNAGLVEVPMGITIRDIVEKIGGGSSTGKKIKAVQTGGPSGGVIPENQFDTPIGYEEFEEIGSILGSGGLIVFDEDDDMVELALFYLDFSVDESCGKCAPCRIGGKQLQLLLKKIVSREAVKSDIETMESICETMEKGSLCGFGKKAPKPITSTLKYFRDEYMDKIKA